MAGSGGSKQPANRAAGFLVAFDLCWDRTAGVKEAILLCAPA